MRLVACVVSSVCVLGGVICAQSAIFEVGFL